MNIEISKFHEVVSEKEGQGHIYLGIQAEE